MNFPMHKETLRRAATGLLRVTRSIFTPLSLLIMAWLIWQARASLGSIADSGRANLLLTAIVLWILGNMLVPAVSVLLIRGCGERMGYGAALHIHCSRLPAKYLPGGIWHSVGRANDYLESGFEPRRVGLYFVAENFLLVAVTLTLSPAIVAPLVTMPWLRSLIMTLPFLFATALLLFPFVVRMATGQKMRIALDAYAGSVLLHFLYWCVNGLTFAIYIAAFDELTDTTLLQSAAIYIFSWCLGYVTLFAPQGIGVSEFVAANLLHDGAVGLLAFLMGFRVLVLVADLLCWGLVAAIGLMGRSGNGNSRMDGTR